MVGRLMISLSGRGGLFGGAGAVGSAAFLGGFMGLP